MLESETYLGELVGGLRRGGFLSWSLRIAVKKDHLCKGQAMGGILLEHH
jgi:hypothetical protein